MAKKAPYGLTKAGKPRKRPKRKAEGRPSKFTAEMIEKLQMLAVKGLTEKEIAKVCGIDESTLSDWKITTPEFSELLKDWKNEADKEVVRSLYERAHGYNCIETKTQWVNGSEGEPGRWETIDMIRHYPPDPTSMIFWLKNRQRDQWRDKVDTEIRGNVDVTIVDYSKVDE